VARPFAAAALLSLAALPPVYAQPAGTTPVPDGGVNSVVMRCRQCGVINAIREIQQTRQGTTPGLGPDSPVGLVLYIPVGPGSKQGDSFAGSVGNREWQNRISTTRYEFTVRMDDGDFRVVNKDGVSDLRIGDRVRVDGGRIERWGG
jgi:outer membrane lipoprotein SlyB